MASNNVDPWEHVKGITLGVGKKYAAMHEKKAPADIFADIDPAFLINGQDNMAARFAVFFHDLKDAMQLADPPIAAYLAPNRLKRCTSWVEVAYEIRNGM